MPFIETDDGIRIHYRTDGSAASPPLVMSNSLGTDIGMWDGQRDWLAERFHLIRYDTRGHGRSDAPAGSYSIDRLGRDVLNLLDALEVHKVTWCGVSLGAMLGMWLATHAPDRVGRMALCNTAAHMPPADLWNERIRLVNESGMAAIADGVLERWLTAPFREAHPEEVARVREMLLATPAAGYAGCCAAVRDMDQRDSIGRIGCDVLVVAGRDDPATPPEKAEEIAAGIAGSELVVFDRCAHLSNIERKDAFAETVLPFLARPLAA